MSEDDFQDRICHICYDFKTGAGALVVDEGNSCDVRDVAETFGRIDPQVRIVKVVIGRHQRAVFERLDGHWVAYR